MSQQIFLLQDQVSVLYEQLNQLRSQVTGHDPSLSSQGGSNHIDPTLQTYGSHSGSFHAQNGSPSVTNAAISPSHHRPRASSQSQQRFKGPTSVAFSLGVAKSSLETMGITGQPDEEQSGSGDAGSGTAEATPQRSPAIRGQLLQSIHRDKDPIWTIPQEETLRLCKVYEDEMGLMYPVVDINKVITYAGKLYRFMEAAHRSGLMQQGLPGSDAIDDEDTNLLKVVMATAMTVEASGRSELGQRMFEYVQPAIDTMLLGAVGVKAIRLLVTTVSFGTESILGLLTLFRPCTNFTATTKAHRGGSLD